MKKFFILVYVFGLLSCATQSLKPADMQSKLALGMSLADVMATLGLPEEKKALENGKLQLNYPGYVLNFADDKLSAVQILSKEALANLDLQSVEQKNPSYKPDSIVLNKSNKPEASAYQVAAYLHDEALFVKAVEAGVNRNGFTLKTNALCVALTEGYLKGTEAVLKAGFNSTMRLRTDKGIYILAKDCVTLQKDPEVAEKLKKLIDDEAQRVEAKQKEAALKGETKVEVDDENNSKYNFNWDDIKEFLKPVGPIPDGKHPEPSKTAPKETAPPAQ